jgi:limonene-1,2-epoxide hydrolase
MTTPTEAVTQFCAAWPSLDLDTLVAFFSDDAVYHNIPVDPVVGRDAIRATLEGFTAGVESVEFEVVHAVADGPIVLTERIDRFIWPTGHVLVLPVMGTFEVHDGLITQWRDYFDMTQFMSQLPATGD